LWAGTVLAPVSTLAVVVVSGGSPVTWWSSPGPTQEGTTLSGGEQQMLAIARALARDLSLLLLDEPYEGLAPHIVAEIEAIMRALKAEGITAILVEQNAVAALRIADRVAIIDDGRVVFTGRPDDVLANDNLRRDLLAV